MKIVTWNCNGAFRKKLHRLETAYDPDLMIVQECEDPAQSTHAYRDWAGEYLWFGENKNKGIGIFDRSGFGLSMLDWDSNGLQSFLPCIVREKITLIAVWTKYANSPNFRYIGQLWKYLQKHKAELSNSKPLLIIGDLNSNTCWDEWDRWWNHSDVVRELEEIGLISLYHHVYGEDQGKESRPTLFHRRSLDKPYHVDYAFATKELFSGEFEIGQASEWLEYSDHMPLMFSING